MKQISYIIKNEKGSVIVVALLILVVLTAIGIAALTTTSIDINIAGNEKFHRIAFYAAEGAREYVRVNTDLYGATNITVGGAITFPDNDGVDNDNDGTVDEAGEQYVLATGQSSFSGRVTYQGEATGSPPEGTGSAVGTTTIQTYQINITGNGPNNAACRILVGFYREGVGAAQ